MTTSGAPASTDAPSTTSTSLTTPARLARKLVFHLHGLDDDQPLPGDDLVARRRPAPARPCRASARASAARRRRRSPPWRDGVRRRVDRTRHLTCAPTADASRSPRARPADDDLAPRRRARCTAASSARRRGCATSTRDCRRPIRDGRRPAGRRRPSMDTVRMRPSTSILERHRQWPVLVGRGSRLAASARSRRVGRRRRDGRCALPNHVSKRGRDDRDVLVRRRRSATNGRPCATPARDRGTWCRTGRRGTSGWTSSHWKNGMRRLRRRRRGTRGARAASARSPRRGYPPTTTSFEISES